MEHCISIIIGKVSIYRISSINSISVICRVLMIQKAKKAVPSTFIIIAVSILYNNINIRKNG